MSLIEFKNGVKDPIFFIELAYDGIMKGDIVSREDILPLIEYSKFKEIKFGWRLFELLTKNADNCKSEMYLKTINKLGSYFKLFPMNHKYLKRSFSGMVANMILGRGKTNFIIRDKEELSIFLSDFEKFGFNYSIIDIFQALFDKRKIRDNLLPKRLFELMNSFIDFENDVNLLFAIDVEPAIIMVLLAEKFLQNTDFRFLNKCEFRLMSDCLQMAKKTSKSDFNSLRKRCSLFLKGILMSLSYDEKTIAFTFSNFFYDSGLMYYRMKKYNLAIICYDYAREFFKILNNERFYLFSEAYYYRYLSLLYSKENRFEEQEFALLQTVLAYEKLISIDEDKFSKVYYRYLLEYIELRILNSLYNLDFDNCIDMIDLFMEKKINFQYYLRSETLNAYINKFTAIRFEIKGKQFFNNGNLVESIRFLELSNENYQKANENRYIASDVSQLLKYYQSINFDLLGEYKNALNKMKELWSDRQSFDDVSKEYQRFYFHLESKILFMEGRFEESKKMIDQIHRNYQSEGYYDEISEKSDKLLKLINIANNYVKISNNIDQYILNFNEGKQPFPYTIRTPNWNYELPIRFISSDYLKLNIKDDFLKHLIRNYEKELNIRFPLDNDTFYPIYENIIIHQLKEHSPTRELIKNMYFDGQSEPLVLSNDGSIIDGNRRLAAFKLSKCFLEEKNTIPLNFRKIKIVKISDELPDSEITLLKIQLNHKPALKVIDKTAMTIDRLVKIKELKEKGFSISDISENLDINTKTILFYLSIYDLIVEFLKREDFEDDLFLIEKYKLLDHFSYLCKELSNLGEQLGYEGTQLADLRRRLKKLTYIWLRNNIDGEMIANNNILKYRNIKKLKFLLIKPNIIKIIDKIINGEISNKTRIHSILDGYVSHIDIREERRSSSQHAKMVYDRIRIIKHKIFSNDIKSEEKKRFIEYIEKSYSELGSLLDFISTKS